MSTLEFAQLDWDEHGQPVSRVFSDVYFARDNGLQETHYVFIEHNDLPERFAALDHGQHFWIGETGFGTGLNFFCTWQLFRETAPPDCHLHFVSAEKFPLSHADLQRALQLWPQFASMTTPLLEQYQSLHAGTQHFVFDEGRTILTLLVGDASDMLATVDDTMDAWFLDGFAPARNADMWSDALFTQLARLSGKDTSIATFASAGFVRRGLIQHGFTMQKVKGFGHKWVMLAGHYTGTTPVHAVVQDTDVSAGSAI